MQADDKRMERLGQGGESPSSLEARAGAFLGDACATAGLTDAEIGAIERRLLQEGRTGRGLRLWPAFAAVGVLFIGGSVMALVSGWRPRLPFVGGTSDISPSHPALPRPKAAHVHGTRATEPSISPAAPADEPAVAEAPFAPSPVPEPRPLAPARRAPRPELLSPPPESVPAESPLSAEARSLAAALARWRRDGNAEVALTLLAAHERRFANGPLAVESKVARAEILLATARRDHALLVLDSLNLAGLPRARELATVRGELRVQAGRCREARADLQRVLQDTPSDEFGRRATAALVRCP
jgi:hypothetical protein